MSTVEKKRFLRERYLKPKVRLRRLRNANDLSNEYMGSLIGVSREQYAKKESGQYPFQDYEMELIAKELKTDIGSIFYDS